MIRRPWPPDSAMALQARSGERAGALGHDGGVALEQPHPVHADIENGGNHLWERGLVTLPRGAAAG